MYACEISGAFITLFTYGTPPDYAAIDFLSYQRFYFSLSCPTLAHIFFDDAMELTDDDSLVPNMFVSDLMDCIDDSLR
ncbi:hypothetical protein DPMN_102945 [Dreissena polymorpha]|uniref:Uncharacterized protein n=1 Tax=Dreissena polymorpha TaxID=45954 RepID=A0A9D4K260_DREPO|nr:hypothetical protein DPMN_102945 [Dreissena polymorpha]